MATVPAGVLRSWGWSCFFTPTTTHVSEIALGRMVRGFLLSRLRQDLRIDDVFSCLLRISERSQVAAPRASKNLKLLYPSNSARKPD
jgi:hypothetical protein